MRDTGAAALSHEGQLSRSNAHLIDPLDPMGCAKRPTRWRVLIESAAPGVSSVRSNGGGIVSWRAGHVDAQDTISRLSGTLLEEGQGRYSLARGKTILFVRLLGTRTSIRFTARDRVVFRIEPLSLTVEDRRTHGIRNTFPWDRIESVAAGELESENSDLFQG